VSKRDAVTKPVLKNSKGERIENGLKESWEEKIGRRDEGETLMRDNPNTHWVKKPIQTGTAM